ncbi:hypothetical protein BJ138DRAFT_1007096 [Hygrophoropsis aurantiaca]|uniref:Uncharacterized protein n=1 Tax=Hygrophoropsis aurantiaca TaxID=72124 RepID=A0ACB8ACG4_9AGAM|nr:hypothetical protein BJ138DRAFT_1007096 [Hygrophoropsis aurantiaca]
MLSVDFVSVKIIIALIILFPSIEASSVSSDGGNCSISEFWYEITNSCLPYGVTSESTENQPPSGKACPSHSSWYWSNEKSCCLPTIPQTTNSFAPACPDQYSWNGARSVCEYISRLKRGSGECADSEFWFEQKMTCLPSGGIAAAPSPPKDSQCPPSGWYWSNRLACCLPRSPLNSGASMPQCSNGWAWSQATWKCTQIPSAPTRSHPSHSPSPSSSARGHNKHNLKRSLKARAGPLCPIGFDACPIADARDFRDYECIDADAELENCGGCTVNGKGKDCTAIGGVWNVGCNQGICEVYTCRAGYGPSFDATACLQL